MGEGNGEMRQGRGGRGDKMRDRFLEWKKIYQGKAEINCG